jgi:hypothetical protein
LSRLEERAIALVREVDLLGERALFRHLVTPADGAIPVLPETMDFGAAKRRLVIGKGFVENVTAAMRAYEISGKIVLDQWFSYRWRDRTKPSIGDKRPPLAARKDSARRLARRIYRRPAEPPQRARPAGCARAAASRFARPDRGGASRHLRRSRTGVGDNGPRAVAIARVLWQTPPTDSQRDEDEPPAMTRHGQLDLFGESQPELPGVERTAAVYRADPNEVRAELLRVLAKVRAAQSFPWDARRTLYWRTVFPQMTNWLPDEEAAQLRFAFETEIRRLEAA